MMDASTPRMPPPPSPPSPSPPSPSPSLYSSTSRFRNRDELDVDEWMALAAAVDADAL